LDAGGGLGLELAGQKPAVRLGEFHRLELHARTFLRARRKHDLGAHHPHQLAPLDRGTIRASQAAAFRQSPKSSRVQGSHAFLRCHRPS